MTVNKWGKTRYGQDLEVTVVKVFLTRKEAQTSLDKFHELGDVISSWITEKTIP